MRLSPRVIGAPALAAVVALLALALLPARVDAARGIDLGLTDDAFQAPDAGTRTAWLDRAKAARAGSVLLGVSWNGVATAQPANPANPADPAYAWGDVDPAVRAAATRGLEVIFFVGGGAPAWAEGANRPGTAAAGTWKPIPPALKDFGAAVAARFSGHFVDPADAGAGPLPRVRDYQLWAEPNLSVYLTPQWKGGRPFAPRHYRKMVNAFGRGIDSVDRSNRVITGGTAPYGDPTQGGSRLPPVRFWREFLCLKGNKLRRAKCKPRPRFDVLAHHPINVGKPRRHAINPLDASTPDIGRIGRVLRKAERSGRAKGPGRHQIWATEIWWDTNPPDPDGVPEAKQARWLAESFYLLWRQGVSKVIWFLIRDQDPGGSFGSSMQSGLFFRDGQPKLAFQAYRFPFVADRGKGGRVTVWGKAPASGEVTIERARAGEWQALARARAGGSRVFYKRIRLRGKADLRARQGGESSLSWALG